MKLNVSSDHVIVYIGIGANLDDPMAQVNSAILQLEKLPATILHAQSSLFCTAPLDADGADYINAVVCLHTQLNAHILLQNLQQIEQDFGRQRLYRNAPRTLDLDLLLYDQAIINDAQLTVPHPGITHRAFVLIPLLEIDPLITIPNYGLAREFIAQVASQRIDRV